MTASILKQSPNTKGAKECYLFGEGWGGGGVGRGGGGGGTANFGGNALHQATK